MGPVWILLFLLLVVVPWVIRTGTGTSKRKLKIVRVMRGVSIAILLLVGVPLVVWGILVVNESRGMDNRGDAFATFFLGVSMAAFGSLLCLVGGLALWAWSRKASREVAGSTSERQGNDKHCKKCGFELIGPGGPCRKCDDVQTRPCSSCGRYILANDRTCPYCGAGLPL
jgi:predicted RNA-binding Zn-ribbon protein involved in translation (DUF1610 family)